MFDLMYKNRKEAKKAYEILQLIKKEPEGIRVYGNTYKMCKYLGISYPYLIKLLKTMENVGLIEYVKHYFPETITQTLTKEETKLEEDVIMHYEKRHRTSFIVLSNSVKFVRFLSSTARDWIRFRRPPTYFELAEEKSDEMKNE